MERETACSLRSKSQKCSLGCPYLDSFLSGGIPCGSLTELVGESASAKTQLCLQLSVTVQLPVREGGLDGSALYVYTENYFPYRRLDEIARNIMGLRRKRVNPPTSRGHLMPLDSNKMESSTEVGREWMKCLKTSEGFQYLGAEKPPQEFSSNGAALKVCSGAANPCNNVFVQGIQTADELLEYLDYANGLLTHSFRLPVKLIIIDSIAALFRSDFENNAEDLGQRTCLFFQVASKLKRYAQKYNLAVVVTNQVTDTFEQLERFNSSALWMSRTQGCDVLMTSGRRVGAALGLSWANCVNTRLFLSRSSADRRSMQVVFAPHLPNLSCDFVVDREGVRGASSVPILSSEVSIECHVESKGKDTTRSSEDKSGTMDKRIDISKYVKLFR